MFKSSNNFCLFVFPLSLLNDKTAIHKSTNKVIVTFDFTWFISWFFVKYSLLLIKVFFYIYIKKYILKFNLRCPFASITATSPTMGIQNKKLKWPAYKPTIIIWSIILEKIICFILYLNNIILSSKLLVKL